MNHYRHPSIYVKGSWKACCDICGFTFNKEHLRKQWNGLMACYTPGGGDYCWSPRHPQELVRATVDRQKVPWTRPCTGYFKPLPCPDCFEIDLAVESSITFDILANDEYDALGSITFEAVPDAGTEGTITYTDSGSVERTAAAGVAIAAADFNSLTFTPVSSFEGTIGPLLYKLTDARGCSVFTTYKFIVYPGIAEYSHAFYFDASNSTSVDEAGFNAMKTAVDYLLFHFEANSIETDVRVVFLRTTNIATDITPDIEVQAEDLATTDFSTTRAAIATMDYADGSGVFDRWSAVKDFEDNFSGDISNFEALWMLDGNWLNVGGIADDQVTYLAGLTNRKVLIFGQNAAATDVGGHDNTAEDGTPTVSATALRTITDSYEAVFGVTLTVSMEEEDGTAMLYEDGTAMEFD